MSDQLSGPYGTTVCQTVCYFDTQSLDISGGREVVDKPLSSGTCDNSNVTVLEFFSAPMPTFSIVASAKAMSYSSPQFILFCVVWSPVKSKILFPTAFSPMGPDITCKFGEKEFHLFNADTPIAGVCFILPPFFILGNSNFESAKYMSKSWA